MHFEAQYYDERYPNNGFGVLGYNSSYSSIADLKIGIALSFPDGSFDTILKLALFLKNIQLILVFNNGNKYSMPLKEKHLQILETLLER